MKAKKREQLQVERQERECGRERRKLVESSSLLVAQIDLSQPKTSKEEEGKRNGQALSSEQAAIVVTEGEESNRKL